MPTRQLMYSYYIVLYNCWGKLWLSGKFRLSVSLSDLNGVGKWVLLINRPPTVSPICLIVCLCDCVYMCLSLCVCVHLRNVFRFFRDTHLCLNTHPHPMGRRASGKCPKGMLMKTLFLNKLEFMWACMLFIAQCICAWWLYEFTYDVLKPSIMIL